ncbi:MAG: peptide MFS transporter [Acidobacteria bacterium]|nr:peptide MFS transporter [Acidobacteriota bacterium]
MAFGHPKGLIPLFFTEMWERLAFYTMVGILLLYTTDAERGGLGLPSAEGNEIYGLYLAFVYFTPFLGGMIADRLLGYRRAVLVGGLLMASGLFLMGTQGYTYFVLGLIGLIVGNGFFKPNISVMVGNLYAPGDPKRDAGFNIFYMGINIGAFVATAFLAPYMRNNFGWLWTFRAAGFGLLIAVTLLLIFWRALANADRTPERNPDDAGFGDVFLKILLPAFAFGAAGYFAARAADFSLIRPAVCGFLAGMIPVLVFFVRLGLKGSEKERSGLLALLPIYVAGGAFFMILHLNGSAMTQWARDETDREPGVVMQLAPFLHQEGLPSYYVNAARDVPRPSPESLLVVEDDRIARMYGQQRMDEAAVGRVATIEGVRVVEIGSGDTPSWEARATNVYADGIVTVEEVVDSHGTPTITVSLPDGAKPLKRVAFVRPAANGDDVALFVIDRSSFSEIFDGYRQRYGTEPNLLPPGKYLDVVNPEVYQSFNALFVIAFTPLVVWFFAWRVRAGKTIATAHKLLYGMILTTGSLLLMAFAGFLTDGGAVKVSSLWLIGFYAIVTLGELCLSPMGLSLVTKLSPKRLVGLTMGGWFLATAFGNNLSGFFGGLQSRMSPMWFFLLLAGLSAMVAVFLFAVLPKLDRAIKQYNA